MQSTEQDENLAPWTFAEPWGGTGHLADFDGPVHWVDFGGLPTAARSSWCTGSVDRT